MDEVLELSFSFALFIIALLFLVTVFMNQPACRETKPVVEPQRNCSMNTGFYCSIKRDECKINEIPLINLAHVRVERERKWKLMHL